MTFVLSFRSANTADPSALISDYDAGNFTTVADGIVVIAVGGSASVLNSSINDITIGGTSVGANFVTTGTGPNWAAIGWMFLAAGTYDVHVKWSANTGNTPHLCVSAYQLTGSAASGTNSATNSQGAGTSLAVTVSIPIGGGAIYAWGGAAASALSWSAATQDAQSNTTRGATAHYTASTGSHTETSSWTGTASALVAVVAFKSSTQTEFDLGTGAFAITGLTLALPVTRKPFVLGAGSYTTTGFAMTFHHGFGLGTGVFLVNSAFKAGNLLFQITPLFPPKPGPTFGPKQRLLNGRGKPPSLYEETQV